MQARRRLLLVPQTVPLLRHTFGGAAVTPSDQGPNLTDIGGIATVSGGVLSKTGAAASTLRARLGVANFVVQWKTNFGGSAGADRRSQVRVRHDTAASNRYNFVLYRSSNTLKIQRADAGVTVDLLDVPTALADSTNYWTRGVVRGNYLEILLSTDGVTWVSKGSVTDANYPTAPAGNDFEINLVDNGTTSITVDDLLVWTP